MVFDLHLKLNLDVNVLRLRTLRTRGFETGNIVLTLTYFYNSDDYMPILEGCGLPSLTQRARKGRKREGLEKLRDLYR